VERKLKILLEPVECGKRLREETPKRGGVQVGGGDGKACAVEPSGWEIGRIAREKIIKEQKKKRCGRSKGGNEWWNKGNSWNASGGGEKDKGCAGEESTQPSTPAKEDATEVKSAEPLNRKKKGVFHNRR